MYIRVDNPSTTALYVRIDGERIGAEFKDGVARVTKNVGELLIEHVDGITLEREEAKDEGENE